MTSTLIIGGGLAGLFAALKMAPAPVTILSPRPLGEGASSAWAQGGIAAAIGEGDSIASHVADTIVAGAGLVDEAITRGMAEEAGGRIADLLAFGVPFDRDLAGKLVQSREAAHSAKRIVRVRGDMAGAAIMAALVAAVRATPSIRVLEGAEAERLIVSKGRVAGARARISGPGGMRRVDLRAGATVLATGGIGQLYALTTNPAEARGEGLAIAAEAGAVVENAEFVQFHPTAIAIGRDPAPLATEALRGEGATLINSAGARFMPALHKDGELAPRDIVARGVFAEIVAGRGAFLDCRHLGGHFAALFPTVHATCLSAGIDPATQPIPIAPAEHYHMGGVKTDARGATSLPGLFAAGEVASTGVHGANRLASNSLLEAVVFAARIAADLAPVTTDPVAISDLGPAPAEPDEGPAILDLRHAMTRHVGVVREAAGLEAAVAAARRAARDALSGRRRRMAEVALIIAAGALARAESRGGHFRNDYPKADAIGRPSLAEPLVTLLGDEETAADAAAPAPARPLAAPPHLPENCR